MNDDKLLFLEAFGEWLEKNGVTLGEFNPVTRRFDATIDLNQLKPALIRMILTLKKEWDGMCNP